MEVTIRGKVSKTLSEIFNVTLDLTVPLEDDHLVSINSIQIINEALGLVVSNPTINTSIIDEPINGINCLKRIIKNNVINPGYAILFELIAGTDNNEYKVQINTTTFYGDTLTIIFYVLVSEQRANYYGATLLADDYFAFNLNSDAWTCNNTLRKIKALVGSTVAINALSYSGLKTDPTQYNEFPRNGDLIPNLDIEFATYELALRLLDGVDIDNEINSLASDSRAYSGVRTTYKRDFALAHVRAGIPSNIAWNYLRPYLRDSQEVFLRRVQ